LPVSFPVQIIYRIVSYYRTVRDSDDSIVFSGVFRFPATTVDNSRIDALSSMKFCVNILTLTNLDNC